MQQEGMLQAHLGVAKMIDWENTALIKIRKNSRNMSVAMPFICFHHNFSKAALLLVGNAYEQLSAAA